MGTDELNQLAEAITAKTLLCTKEVLTSDEAAQYMGISKSHLYKLTMNAQIPYSKPMGKKCYFSRRELEQWLLANPVTTKDEISSRANQYCLSHRGF